MPATKATNGVASAQSAPASKRFELPALDLKFGSLTDGTDIPPPLPSPKEEQSPPQPKPIAKKEEKTEEPPKPQQPQPQPQQQQQQTQAEVAHGPTNGTSPKTPGMSITTNVGLKRSADDVPVSPAPSSRGSLRRLFSKTLLNHAYQEQGSTATPTATTKDLSRPPSRSASVIAGEKKAKRSSGWFRRLRTQDHASDGKPAALQFGQLSQKPSGPPPPMIPELSALETKVDTRLGDDLFKGIGRDL
ncbi:hypothetical protein F4777DRAFT_575593 [Nemania sp. FL0916]|nr:hypothetical protein F4777DRAFT_575593 [Nemania sp. FL0916]